MQIIKIRGSHENEITVEVSDEIFNVYQQSKRDEHAQYERDRYHGVIPLDWVKDAYADPSLGPEAHWESTMLCRQLYSALEQLPEIQRRRLIFKYFFDMSLVQIARLEGVSKSAVHFSIAAAKKNLKKLLL
ncbi:hypothetical protein LJC42_06215 [Eubacteriales bacterium OttesenSCG-928-K08]|nr:hypothetical protein [Eubacteriales bacterium OttesenSCG-928-K08]